MRSDESKKAATPVRAAGRAVDRPVDELPVVARLVVEIRSDGSRTVARGAMEDPSQGVRVGVEAEGATPTELAAALARSMLRLPLLHTADQVFGIWRRRVRALLPGKK